MGHDEHQVLYTTNESLNTKQKLMIYYTVAN